jgi:hypothetical protein
VNSRDNILLQSMVYGARYVSADSVNNQTCSLQESWLEQNTELLCVLIFICVLRSSCWLLCIKNVW